MESMTFAQALCRFNTTNLIVLPNEGPSVKLKDAKKSSSKYCGRLEITVDILKRMLIELSITDIILICDLLADFLK